MQVDLFKKYLIIGIVLLFIFSNIPIIKCTNMANSVQSDFPATGFFYVAKKDGIWWFVTPKGEKFYSMGIGIVTPNEFYYGNYSDWAKIADENIKNWNYNTLYWSDHELFPHTPYVYIFGFQHITGNSGWVCERFPDVFDPEWKDAVRKQINDTAEDLRDDPNLIGYHTGNEMKWGPDIGDYDHGNDTFIELFMCANATTPGKQRLISFFSERYDNNTELFNHVWNMNISNFKELEKYKRFGFEGWRVQSKLKSAKIKLFKDYPMLLKEPQLLKQAQKDITDFSRLTTGTYFNVTDTALEAADSNHLNLGVRFHSSGVPREVLEECGKYVDVISINYYRARIFVYDPSDHLNSLKYGCVTLDNWMRNYYEITSKPLLISESGFAYINDDMSYLRFIFSGSPPLTLYSARTQQGVSARYKWYAENCFKNSYVVGHFCFAYRDLVDIWDRPYQKLVNNIAKINKKAIELHEKAPIAKTINNNKEIKTIISPDKQSLFFLHQLIGKNYHDYLNEFLNFAINSMGESLTANELDGTETIGLAYNDDTLFYYEPDIYVDNDFKCPGDGEHPYCKIQYAIDNASDGDTIFVYDGIYDEKIIINKSLNLVGENRETTVIRGLFEEPDTGYNDNVITIQSNHVNITGFNITNKGGYIHNFIFTRYCAGIYLNNYSSCGIFGNNFYNLGRFGIKILRGNNTIIKNNIIYKALNKRGCSIFLDLSNYSIIKDNYLFESTVCCLWMSRCTSSEIQDNIVMGSPSGIILQRSNKNIISGNVIEKNTENGVILKESNQNIIKNNNFVSNPKSVGSTDSYDNVWNGNYWGRPRILPKPIFGRTGLDGLIIQLVGFDYHPLKAPYKQ